MIRFHKLALGAAFVAAVGMSPSSIVGNVGQVSALTPEETATEADATAKAAEEILKEAEPYAPPAGSASFEYEAEVHKMLDIVVNSLYTNKDVFLRELISNASDALDKIRFMSVTKPELLDTKKELEVKIEYDEEARTLTIRDSGIGMTKDDLIKNLGTVARSGTTNFVKALGEGAADVSMIGMFGVGFYSSFLVADRVTVASKNNDDDTQHIWESLNGEASFHVGPDPRGNTLGRGTEITLHLKEDAEEYLSAYKLKEMIRHYSEFVTHPVYLREVKTIQVPKKQEETEKSDEEKKDDIDDIEDVEEMEEEEEKEPEMEDITTFEDVHINTDPAIWARDKDEITDEEYQEFWKVVSKEGGDAADWSHFNAEGNINFKSILYLPNEVPFALAQGRPDELRPGLRLYVRKVLISDEFDLMPRYLNFIKGVVDSDDLPLNVNRETLQESKIIKIIKKKLVRKAIETIRNLANKKIEEDNEPEEAEIDADGNPVVKDKPAKVHPYIQWYKKFGLSLKMGCIDDSANRDKLQKLLRFKSSKTKGEDDFVSLQEYVDRMQDWQKEIYVFPGESMKTLEESSFMDAFKEKDIEVLFLTEAIDEFWLAHSREFDGKKYRDITKEGIKFSDEDEDLTKRREKVYADKFKPLTKYLKKLFGGNVMKVTISKRLGKAPAIVSASEYGQSANMDRLQRAQAFTHTAETGSHMPTGILELNPRHPLVIKLLESLPEGDDEEVPDSVKDAAWMLFDTATMSGGFPIRDPKKYAARMTRILKNNLGVESLALADEIDPPVEEEEPEEPAFNVDDINLDDLEAMNIGGDTMSD